MRHAKPEELTLAVITARQRTDTLAEAKEILGSPNALRSVVQTQTVLHMLRAAMSGTTKTYVTSVMQQVQLLTWIAFMTGWQLTTSAVTHTLTTPFARVKQSAWTLQDTVTDSQHNLVLKG